MTTVEALRLALEKEEDAIKLYQNLGQEYSEIKDLLLFLLNEEEKHKKMIEGKIAEVTRY